jgi:hypothetical protein
MDNRVLASALFGASVVVGYANAGMTVTNSQALWNYRVTSGGQVVGTESFDTLSGNYPTGVSGSVGGISWTANAPGGLKADLGELSTTSGNVTLTFNFSPGVRAVAGNIFGTDNLFNVVSSIVTVSLSDGTSYEGFTSSTSDFVGFYSSTANISSVAITTAPALTGSVFPTINNLYFAVPAPGTAALVALAGLAARRRRSL